MFVEGRGFEFFLCHFSQDGTGKLKDRVVFFFFFLGGMGIWVGSGYLFETILREVLPIDWRAVDLMEGYSRVFAANMMCYVANGHIPPKHLMKRGGIYSILCHW